MQEYVTGHGHVILLDDDVVVPGVLSVTVRGYVRTTRVVKNSTVLLHHWLTDTVGRGHEVIVEHVDNDQLNCQRANLSVVPPNQAQHGPGARRGRELPTGVYPTGTNRYKAALTVRGVYQHLGTFDTAQEAAAARQILLAELQDP